MQYIVGFLCCFAGILLFDCAGRLSQKNETLPITRTRVSERDTIRDSLVRIDSGNFTVQTTPFIDTSALSSPPDTTLSFLRPDSLMPAIDTFPIIPIDQIHIFTPVRYLDFHFSSLVNEDPFSHSENQNNPDTIQRYRGLLQAEIVSENRIKITCTENLVNARGKPVTAIDLIRAWSGFIRECPSLAYSLFQNVRGVKEFIENKEAIIQGFIASSKNEVILLYNTTPQKFLLETLDSPFLLPTPLTVGKFFIVNQDSTTILLQKNEYFPFVKPSVNRYTLFLGNDPNPVVSFSLHKYDIALLYKKKDLDYCRKNLLSSAHLLPADTMRYFLSLSSPSADIRSFIRSKIIPREILRNTVRAEGDCINSLFADTATDSIPFTATTPPFLPPGVKKVIILYHAQDPVGTAIAEKIFSLLSPFGLAPELRGLSNQPLQYALFKNEYDIAVGAVAGSVLHRAPEQHRIARMWFDKNPDEKLRLTQAIEIPLFSVNFFALCNKELVFTDSNFLIPAGKKSIENNR
jgi:hypothetical protein